MNQTYLILRPEEQLQVGIESVANPDTKVFGRYTTLSGDLVIAAVRLIKSTAGLPEPPQPNVTNPFSLADVSGHGFLTSYLSLHSNSRTKILTEIVLLIRELRETTLSQQ